MRDILRLSAAAALCAALSPTIANAAEDGPWTGLHAGVNLGYGDYTATWNDENYDWYGGGLVFRSQGFIPGVQVGYDHQFGSLVLGAAFDWDRPAINASFRYADDDNVENNAKEIRTLRLRAGLTIERTLVYATVGISKGKFEHQWEEDNDPTDSWPRFINDRTGHALGMGVEQLVGEAFSIRAELLTYTFKEIESTNEDGFTMRVKDEILAARLGASYRF